MESKSPFDLSERIGESNAAYRERMERVQAEAVARRQKDLQEQSSPVNEPGMRIRIWERLHEIELPRNPTHPLIGVIAANTGLSKLEVLAEQSVRATATTEPGAPVPVPVPAASAADGSSSSR